MLYATQNERKEKERNEKKDATKSRKMMIKEKKKD
jgi:hypothetical protein